MNEPELFLQLTGRSEQHLQTWQGACQVHGDAFEALSDLCRRGAKAGFDVKLASGFRSYQRQCDIWNAKVRGDRPVLDKSGQPLDINKLDDGEKVLAILRWSALPGASRHHWGSDFDLWDSAAVPDDYHLQLVVEEYEAEGPFYLFSEWLEQEIEAQPKLFSRPYYQAGLQPGSAKKQQSHCGVAREPWHLSYRPVACRYEALLDPSALKAFMANSELELKDAILANWDTIYTDFIKVHI